MLHPILLFFLSATPHAAAARHSVHRPAAGLIISSIKIEPHDVFNTEAPPENKLLYRAANGIHLRTHEIVIARELLFAVGDRLAPELLEETERNLRGLGFIRRAEITATVNAKRKVDVIVRTYDAWTLEVVASFKRVGGVASYKAGLADHNLMGAGKSLSGVYSRSGGAESKSFSWKDPQFLGKQQLEYSMAAESSYRSRNYALSLGRPFYASTARRSWGTSAVYGEHDFSTVSGLTVLGTTQKRLAEVGANYGVALGISTKRTRHVRFGVLAHRADYLPIPGVAAGQVPPREQLGFLQLGGDYETLDFIKARRIQKFTRDEDYNLGLGVFPSVAWAPYSRALGTNEAQIVPKVVARKAFAWSSQLLILSSGYSSKYVNGGNGRTIASLDASYFVRGLRYQTLAFHAAVDHGWRLDPYSQLSLGEVNGLRGYGLSQFTGDRRFLLNVEDRLFVWDELFRLIDVGAVAFYDSGYAWPAASPVKPGDLKHSVGMGLRLAPSRSGGNSPVRIDMAYALSDNRSRSRWSLSILAGQAFGPGSN